MKKLILALSLIPLVSLAQNYNIQEHVITFSGEISADNLSDNTYFDALVDTVEINWEIIVADMPEEWQFSNCFPNCYPPGALTGSHIFEQGSDYYLNCHIYPFNTAGEAIIQMQITDGIATDTVIWYATALSTVGIEEMIDEEAIEIEAIYDLSGRRISSVRNQEIVIIRYKNGTTRKVYAIEE